MNYLAIDYGTKTIGLAYSLDSLIFTLPSIKNDSQTLSRIQAIVTEYRIQKVYVGLSEGFMVKLIHQFVDALSTMLLLPVETVEEAVSTIEAQGIFKKNKKNTKSLDQKIDSIAAAVILNRVIGS